MSRRQIANAAVWPPLCRYCSTTEIKHDASRTAKNSFVFLFHTDICTRSVLRTLRRCYSILRSVSPVTILQKERKKKPAVFYRRHHGWLLMQNTNGVYRSNEMSVFIYRWFNFSQQNSWSINMDDKMIDNENGFWIFSCVSIFWSRKIHP